MSCSIPKAVTFTYFIPVGGGWHVKAQSSVKHESHFRFFKWYQSTASERNQKRSKVPEFDIVRKKTHNVWRKNLGGSNHTFPPFKKHDNCGKMTFRMGFSLWFLLRGQVERPASRLHPTATQESLQAHGGLNCCNCGIRASPTCRIACGRFGPRGVTIGSNELGKLSGLLLGAIPGGFSVGGRDPTQQAACCE